MLQYIWTTSKKIHHPQIIHITSRLIKTFFMFITFSYESRKEIPVTSLFKRKHLVYVNIRLYEGSGGVLNVQYVLSGNIFTYIALYTLAQVYSAASTDLVTFAGATCAACATRRRAVDLVAVKYLKKINDAIIFQVCYIFFYKINKLVLDLFADWFKLLMLYFNFF